MKTWKDLAQDALHVQNMANVKARINIPETTINAGSGSEVSYRMILSNEGAWIDELDDEGNVVRSSAMAWEEMQAHEVESYLSLLQLETNETETLAMTG